MALQSLDIVRRSATTTPSPGVREPATGTVAKLIDTTKCIGCKACVQACEECGTHRGRSMIHLELVDPGSSVQTAPMVCMHCTDPTCAEVCPADAIKQNELGVVQSAMRPRCIGCSNCVLACPFGVPKYYAEIDQMMKCDMCYDRTSVGKRPMCATVCPSQALAFTTREEIERTRRGAAINQWTFGSERYSFELAAQEGGCRLIFIHVFEDRALAAQTAAGWETYLSRLEPHLAGGHLSEEQAHEPWEEIHERYAERFGVDPTPGRRFLAAQRAEQ